MQVGVFYFPTNYGIDVRELAQTLVVWPVSIARCSKCPILRLLDNYAPLAAKG